MFCKHWRNKAKLADKKAIRAELRIDEINKEANKIINDIREFAEYTQKYTKFLLDAQVLSGYGVSYEVTLMTSLTAIDEVIRKYKRYTEDLEKTNIKLQEKINLLEDKGS